MVNQLRLVREFLKLAAVNGPSGAEANVANELRRRLSALDVASELDDAGASFGGNCGNLIARVPGTTDAPTVLLSAHMDTVQPTLGLIPSHKDGVIRTDGTTILGADDRAGIAIILEILHVLRDKNIPHGPLEIVFTVCEESGLQGAKALDTSKLQASYGLVFDSGAACGDFVIEAPAGMAFHAVVQGRAAHAAIAPEQGVHAIQIASSAIHALKLGRWDATGMMNVGTISGGTAVNVIPDRVEVLGEVRHANPSRLQEQMDQVQRAFEDAATQRGGTVNIIWKKKYDGFLLPEDAPVVRLAVAGIRAAGFEPGLLRYPGGSDANIINGRGIPTVNLGIGYVDVHSMQESMSVKNLVDSARIGVSILRTIVEQHGSIT